MGVKYIRIVSTNDLSEILCESKCGWLVVGGWWYCGLFLGRVVGHCLHVSKQQQHANNKPTKLMHAMRDRERPNQR